MSSWSYSNYSKIRPEVLKNFPFASPRPGQAQTVSEILDAIDKGYKYIVLEAGPGTGKSAIAATLSNIVEDSYILTITKQLQDQYLRDFADFKLVKGRQNFHCLNCDASCDMGKCLTEDFRCPDKKGNPPSCPYYLQKYEALNAKTVVSNYHYIFLELNYVEDFTRRSLMVCDEAHNLEQVLMNQLQLEFNRTELKKYLNFNVNDAFLEKLSSSSYTYWIKFINRICDMYIKKLEKCEVAEEMIFFKNQISACRQFMVNIAFDPKMWIFNWDEETESVQFKPLKIDHYANLLFRHADVCLFMSATVLDFELFSKYLGIKSSEIYAIRKKSPFDAKRNPIIEYEGYNLSKSFLNVNASKSLNSIRHILEKHKNDKGIIHTVSGSCMEFILKNIDDERLIKADCLDEYISSEKPLVLVSPSLDEGVDLPGDLCRFQIIYKIPYLDLSDRQIRARIKEDSDWYDYKTTLRLIQTHGRGMRDEDDWCKTYIVDSRFRNYIINNPYVPDTFLEAVESKNADKIISEGERYIEKQDYQKAVAFYMDVINKNIFINDAYPYRRLSEVYRELEVYDEEINIILRVLKSNIRCGEDDLHYFKKRLFQLEKQGYFDLKLLSQSEIFPFD